MDKNIVFTMHAGSGNHGCEAIVNSTCHMLSGKQITVISARPGEDMAYSLGKLCAIRKEHRITESLPVHLFYFLKKLLTGSSRCYVDYRFREILKGEAFDAAVSIGGDNYCYPEQVEELMLLNQALCEKGTKTILWGASVEPKLLEREDVRQDMNRYAHIFAREKITYEALKAAGIQEDKLHLYPDPAFCLETVFSPDVIGEGIPWNEAVGINLSPMILEREKIPGMAYRNFETLVRHILKETPWHVVLIPHVVWDANDDRGPLTRLYETFRESGRVTLLPDASCTVLKGWISQLKFLVAARTHASIAAYSSQVPTLVAGYSVKAKGIAEDLFGTAEGYVVPVQEMTEEAQLWEAFAQMTAREAEIRQLLAERMPGYIAQAKAGGEKLAEVLDQ